MIYNYDIRHNFYLIAMLLYGICLWLLPVCQYDYFMNTIWSINHIWIFLFICVAMNMSTSAISLTVCNKNKSEYKQQQIIAILICICQLNSQIYIWCNIVIFICVSVIEVLTPLSIYYYWAEKNGYSAM